MRATAVIVMLLNTTPALAAVFLLQPAGGAITGTSQTFEWGSDSSAFCLGPSITISNAAAQQIASSGTVPATPAGTYVYTANGLPDDGQTLNINIACSAFEQANVTATAYDAAAAEEEAEEQEPVTGELTIVTGLDAAQLSRMQESIMLAFVIAFGFRLILRQLRY